MERHLILMVALGEVIKLTQEEGKPEHGEQMTSCWQWLSDWWSSDTQTAWWQHATEFLLGANTYVILLFFALVLPTGYYLTKFIWKKVKCLVTWLRH